MALSQVSTTQEGMSAARAEFEQKASIFTGQLASVNSEMAVLQNTWQGDASMAFSQAMDHWEEGFQKAIAALHSMIESLGGNAALFRTQEDLAASTAQRFSTLQTQGLPGI
ncbi:WXG100 family type VII secretion target [Micromonospora sp. HUAS LYJ1]|uniref:WXG100 family type VII secretion target n=1 Tax=Micromonospora sp. HUAS LYJ1 TaxID=3061626 RepID=UPI0026713417|nr:WXG100 family type VII secretion target [Micromonospora sp. HUAS LYJ1]WKU05342.1 WXG100 family type VII secretion target [Micromonospora sp. HUAS LYJ1]